MSERPPVTERVERLFFDTPDGERLHVRYFPASPQTVPRPPVLFLHGAVENGRIFYSASGKGLAPYVARHGYDCYVLDFRGRGESHPPISRASEHGQTEIILGDIPIIIREVRARAVGRGPMICVAHSWGGVLLLAAMARLSNVREAVGKVVCFGTKRSVKVQNIEKWVKIDLIWGLLGRALTFAYGYLPARQWRFGSDQETKRSHAHSLAWVSSSAWLDPVDGFDYRAASAHVTQPPILSVVGTKDFALGHRRDAARFFAEAGATDATTVEVPFDHVGMLTAPEAERVVYPTVVEWLRRAIT